MSSPALEAFLARLYTEPELLAQFLADPGSTAAMHAGLDATQIAALHHVDRAGLQMAATSIARKRQQRHQRKSPLQRLLRLFQR